MAAQYGSVTLVMGRGDVRQVDAYFDDTAGNPVRFDGGGGASATSPTFYTVPRNCIVTDVVLAAATGQTKTQINRNNQPTGNILRNSVHLASVVTRPALRIMFAAGSNLSMTQLA